MRSTRYLVVTTITLVMIAGAGCGGSPTEPPPVMDDLSESFGTASIDFRWATGDSVQPDWQEGFHQWALGYLGVSVPARIRYNKYRNRAHMQGMTGRSTNGWADPGNFTIHSIWPRDGHEAIHVYTALIGTPSDFFNEGIAVALNVDPDGAFGPLWQGMHVHDYARNLQRQGQLIPLADCVETNGFRSFPDLTTYAEAGSFVRWMIDEHGIGAMRAFFSVGSRGDGLARIRSLFEVTFGLTLQEVEAGWLDFLQAG